jgi:hypothetical protein
MLTESDIAAINGCFASRGANKGKLLASAPKSATLAYAAWQAMVLAWNPYKASVFGMIMFSDEQRACHKRVLAWAEANMHLRGLDRDRLALERIGAW